MTELEEIKNFLDDSGKIKSWPSKYSKKVMVLEYLATKFEPGVDYTEKQVNEIINNWHKFNDYFILRRGLVDLKLLFRERDGSRYWRPGKN